MARLPDKREHKPSTNSKKNNNMPITATASFNKLASYFCLLFLVFAATSVSAYQTRIIGGDSAKDGAWPSVVRLELSMPDGGKRLCAGTLISSVWVLSAAHCFHNPQNQQVVFADNVSAYPGINRLSEKNSQTHRSIQNIIIHSQFALNAPYDYDFALLELSHPVDLPVSTLLTQSPKADELTTVIGWGIEQLDSETGSPLGAALAQTLKQVDVAVVSNQQCSNAMGNLIYPSMVCAGFPQGGKDSCDGDSGSPMLVLRNGIYAQAGIVSFGIGCAQPNRYGVYSRITHALAWIIELVPDVQLSDAANVQRKIAAPEVATTPAIAQLGDEGSNPEPRQGGGGLSMLGLLGLLLIKRAKVSGNES